MEKRRPNRLRCYDYSQNGAYFLTLCTKNMLCVFWNSNSSQLQQSEDTVYLSAAGIAADTAIREIPLHYSDVTVPKHVIMPNHVHMILQLTRNEASSGPGISHIIQQLKSTVTKQTGISIWQKSFHDHIIRDEKEYLSIWKYIDKNPMRWQDDCYYVMNEPFYP